MDIQRELYNACMEGDLLRVKKAISNGADVQAYDNALCWAAYNGHLGVVEFLIANGADVRANSNCALRLAASSGHLKVVKFLIANGADVQTLDNEALRWAAHNGHLEVVEFLIANGANNGHLGVVNYLKSIQTKELYNACREGDLSGVKKAISNGANVRANDNEALRWAAHNGHLKVVKYLIDAGADVQADNNEALRWAAESGHLEVVKYLIDAGANVQANDIYWAANNGHLGVVNYLKSIQTKGEKTMKKSTKEELFSIFTKSFADASKMVASTSTVEGISNTIEKLMGEKFPAALNLPLIAKFKPAIVTALALVAVTTFENQIPKAKEIKSLAETALTACLYDALKPFVMPLKDALSNLWEALPNDIKNHAGDKK